MGISGERCNLLEKYLAGRFQRVILNGQTSSLKPVLAGVPWGSSLGPLLLLVYISDLPSESKSNAKTICWWHVPFAIVKDNNESANILSDDLQLTSRWTFNWRTLFNPDLSKPAQEVLFSRKSQIQNHSSIRLNNV